MLNNEKTLEIKFPTEFERPAFSQWMMNTLPQPEKGYYVSDLDIFLKRRCSLRNLDFISLWEVKTRGKDIPQHQKIMIQLFRTVFSFYFKFNNTINYIFPSKKSYNQKIKYCGFHTLILSGASVEDSEKIVLDGKEISKERLIEAMSFNIYFKEQEQSLNSN